VGVFAPNQVSVSEPKRVEHGEHGEQTKGYLARDLKTVHCTDCETDTTSIFVRLATISVLETSGFLGLRRFEGHAAGFTGEKGPTAAAC
jgi:hypothetical protein